MTTTRVARVLSLAVCAAVLAGCSGIPSRGQPVAGEFIDDQIDFEIGDAPEGPRTGASQEEILVEFISAATSPQDDFRIARKFLAREFENEWEPDSIVRLASGAGESTASDDSRTRFDYEFSTRASVTSNGQYLEQPEADTATLNFRFVKERGEWRIIEAPPGIVISEDRFDNIFASQPLYFFDPSFKYLVPDVRWFPKQPRAASRAVQALLAGPSDWLASGAVISAFPAGTTLGQDLVVVESGVATVDLTEEVRDSNAIERDRIRQQLSASLASVSGGLSSVVITIGGTPLSVPQPSASAANLSPEVNDLPLVGRDGEFGFASDNGIAPISIVSNRVEMLKPRAATIAREQTRVAVLGARGHVFLVGSGDRDPVRVDKRPGLIAPAIDNSGFVWTVPRNNPSAIRATNDSGQSQSVASSLPRGARIASLDVSRDGSRVLLYYTADGGSRLAVAGITRQDGVPTALGELKLLPVASGDPMDAAWIDEKSVATLARQGRSTSVTAHTIGGPSEALGSLDGGKSIVGGNGGTVGLSVLADNGEIFRPRAAVWQKTETSATFIATQQ